MVHGLWPYIPGEFDDYIATPKGNFYRSIHTAVIGPQGKSVEVQIRTREMHEHAELGVAAHWTLQGGRRDAMPSTSARSNGCGGSSSRRRARRPARPTGSFSSRSRSELFEDRVYALTPKGEVIDLPRGATPLDFAYSVHTSLGHRCRGAKVNGRIVPLTYTLANGEIVEIITGKQDAPSRDWLAPEQGFLASPRNRAKVRAWFRKHDAAAADGHEQPSGDGESQAGAGASACRRRVRHGPGPPAALRQWKSKASATCRSPSPAAARRCRRSRSPAT